MIAAAHDHRLADRSAPVITLLASILPAQAGDPRAADRGGPRGRDAADQPARPRTRAKAGLGVPLGLARRDRASAMFAGGVSAARGRAAARRRRARAVRRHRAARAAARQAARPRGRLAGAPRRRRRRRAGRRQRRPQPRPHRVDRRRAHDRAHARDGRGGARRRPQRRDEVGDHRPGPRRLRHRRQARTCRSGPTRATSSRPSPASRPRRTSARTTALVQGKENTISGIDPATIAHFYRFNWTTGSERTLEQLGTDGALVTKAYAEDKHLKVGSQLSLTDARGRQAHARRPRHLRPARRPSRCSATSASTQQAFDTAFANPKNSFTFLDADAGAGRGDRVRGQGLRRREAPHRGRVPEGRHQGHGHDAGHALRAAGLLGHREPVRHGQHDGALGVRAHPRDRDAADDRHDAPPGAPHDPPREHHHGADRRRARPRARRCSSPRSSPRRSEATGLPLAIPVQTLAGFTLVAVLAGIGAAILPARRASRLNVLDALQYE